MTMQNNILQQAEDKIESQLTPQNQADYKRIVVAGMKAGLQGGPNSILASLKDSKDPIQDAAKGAINLCAILWKDSRGTMPLKAMVPAAMTLMLQALNFADKAGIVKVGAAELSQATHYFTNHFFQMIGVTPEMLNTAARNVHGIMSDPAKVEKLQMAAGVIRHPAAAPVQAPQEEGV